MANKGLGFAPSTQTGKWVNGNAKFAERDGKWAVKFIESGEVWKFDADKLPEFPAKISTEIEYYVSLALDEFETKVEVVQSIRPLRWRDELMLVVDCTRTDGGKGEPTFYTKTYKYDKGDTEVSQVNWMLEFQEGDYKGVIVPYNVHYRFTSDAEGNTIWNFSQYQYEYKNATRIRQVVEFYAEQMEVVSPDWPMKWPDDGNVVPELLARILQKKRYVRTFGKDGWISDMEVDNTIKAPAPVVDNAPIPTEEKVKTEEPTPFDAVEETADGDWFD